MEIININSNKLVIVIMIREHTVDTFLVW